jgi:tRNA-Thr(GGU) m(6)t(6)A37 methyltransferase TsaA
MSEDEVVLRPIGIVRSPRSDVSDDFWGDVTSIIELADHLPANCLDGLETFSHAEIIFLFDRVSPADVVSGARHPRNNPAWPLVGIFAQRAKARPNRLGTTIVRIVSRDGRQLRVSGLDAVDGTPVIDVKPVMAEFLPREPIVQPDWSRQLMTDYWKPGQSLS